MSSCIMRSSSSGITKFKLFILLVQKEHISISGPHYPTFCQLSSTRYISIIIGDRTILLHEVATQVTTFVIQFICNLKLSPLYCLYFNTSFFVPQKSHLPIFSLFSMNSNCLCLLGVSSDLLTSKNMYSSNICAY